MATEIGRKDPLAGFARLVLRHLAKAKGLPCLLAALDDEGRRVGVELVGMSPNPAALGFFEDEGEGVIELLARAEPHELAFSALDLGREVGGILTTNLRIEAVAGDHQVEALGKLLRALHLGLKAQFHAKLTCALLQQQQQLAAADATKAMA